jgi:hypothetical protein
MTVRDGCVWWLRAMAVCDGCVCVCDGCVCVCDGCVMAVCGCVWLCVMALWCLCVMAVCGCVWWLCDGCVMVCGCVWWLCAMVVCDGCVVAVCDVRDGCVWWLCVCVIAVNFTEIFLVRACSIIDVTFLKVLSSIKTPKRIVLTGTPLQNNLYVLFFSVFLIHCESLTHSYLCLCERWGCDGWWYSEQRQINGCDANHCFNRLCWIWM